jgi:hypothetical protein
MNIFSNSNKIEMLTQQVNDLTERIEKLEYILRRYPPPYNPYFKDFNNFNAPQQEQPTYVPPNQFPIFDNKWSNNNQ